MHLDQAKALEDSFEQVFLYNFNKINDMMEGTTIQSINFSCDCSSISRNVGRSVYWSVGLSVRNEFYRSVMLLLVYECCYCGSAILGLWKVAQSDIVPIGSTAGPSAILKF